MIARTLLAAVALFAIANGAAVARDRIQIVGSSTVFPFAAKVAERFGKTTAFPTPIVESTGSGGGFKLFCAGVGVARPDITNASRRIKKSEIERCRGNGVTGIVEVKIGYDGIVIANSKKGPRFDLTLRHIFLALAREVPTNSGGLAPNPFLTWREIDPSLPDERIEVMGPPPTSGTRDAFVELAMEGGCNTFDWIKALKKTDKNRYKRICHTLREDGAFIEAGENDNLIVQKLVANPSALGIFGFSYLDRNTDRLKGGTVNGIAPEFDSISDGTYPVSRPLFFYVKAAHVGVIPGIPEYVDEFTGDRATGPEGYLADKGLIPLPADEHRRVRRDALALAPLAM